MKKITSKMICISFSRWHFDSEGTGSKMQTCKDGSASLFRGIAAYERDWDLSQYQIHMLILEALMGKSNFIRPHFENRLTERELNKEGSYVINPWAPLLVPMQPICSSLTSDRWSIFTTFWNSLICIHWIFKKTMH